ncbi:MAG: hypothetical protein V4465_02295 [Patescibacteria group bacterium]
MANKYVFVTDPGTLEFLQKESKILSPLVLGIEIEAKYAPLCGLGNIRAGGSKAVRTSIIERALNFNFIVRARRQATILGARPNRQCLSAMAIFAIREGNNTAEINNSLISWIGACDRLGFEKACELYPKLAGRYTDSGVIDALEVISTNDHWPNPKAKISEMVKIFAGPFPKTITRHFATWK